MKIIVSVALLLLFQTNAAIASPATPSLPPLEISKLGELVLEGDKFDYRQWQSEQDVDKVHVLQYFPGTMSASKTFEPFTDYLQATYELGTYHVTTVINLDEAMWGTSGLIISEVKKSKQRFPMSTLVLDKSGKAVDVWPLGERGMGLFILDTEGRIHFQAGNALSEQEQQKAAAVMQSLMDAQQQATLAM